MRDSVLPRHETDQSVLRQLAQLDRDPGPLTRTVAPMLSKLAVERGRDLRSRHDPGRNAGGGRGFADGLDFSGFSGFGEGSPRCAAVFAGRTFVGW